MEPDYDTTQAVEADDGMESNLRGAAGEQQQLVEQARDIVRDAGRVNPPMSSDANGMTIGALEASPPVMQESRTDELAVGEDVSATVESPVVQQEAGEAVESNGTT